MAVSVRVMALIIGFCGVVSFIFGVIAENKKPFVNEMELIIEWKGEINHSRQTALVDLHFLGRSWSYSCSLVVDKKFNCMWLGMSNGKGCQKMRHIQGQALGERPASGTPITGKGVVICKYPSDPSIALGYLSLVFLIGTTVAGFLSLFYPYKGKSVPQGAMFRSTSFVVFLNIAIFSAGLAGTFLLWPTIQEQLHRSRNVHHNLDTDCPTAKTGLLGGGAFLSLDSCLFWLVALMLADNAREDYFDETKKGGVVEQGEAGEVFMDDYDTRAPSKSSA
ncbi:hypothetical protein CJ030_MR8G021836 [Morella rubra]|uniref:Uncharacterized protein n=1 Tax=Morella rubra TaxID=262757 RepID=A0A6A1UVU6_9ROSI|nr:hypothetical protein CJ030_MR8G021836 [Morella rubra]